MPLLHRRLRGAGDPIDRFARQDVAEGNEEGLLEVEQRQPNGIEVERLVDDRLYVQVIAGQNLPGPLAIAATQFGLAQVGDEAVGGEHLAAVATRQTQDWACRGGPVRRHFLPQRRFQCLSHTLQHMRPELFSQPPSQLAVVGLLPDPLHLGLDLGSRRPPVLLCSADAHGHQYTHPGENLMTLPFRQRSSLDGAALARCCLLPIR